MADTAERDRKEEEEEVKGEIDALPPLEDRVVDEAVLLEFSCAICLHLIEEPRQCSFGHNICLACFQNLVKHSQLRTECPTCRAPMDRERPNRNLVLENLLAKLDVFCRYHYILVSNGKFEVDEEGCNEHMSRMEIEKHERKCPSAFVACPHSQACGSIRRGRLESHLAECIYMPIACPYCGEIMMRRRLEAHTPDCPDLPLSCAHCSLSIAQKRMPRHLQRDCDGILHPCPYAPQGCVDAGEMSAADLSLHLRECAPEHLELVQLQSLQNAQLVENKFMKLLAIKDAEIDELRRASRNRYRFSWAVPWKHSPGDTTFRAFTSEKFDIFGRKFYLALWPIGEPNMEIPDSKLEPPPADDAAASLTPYGGNTSPPIAITGNTSHTSGSSASSHSNATLGTSPTPPTSSSVPTSPASSSYMAHYMQQRADQQQLQQQQQELSTSPQASTATPTPAPQLGASPRSFSSQLFDRFKNFVRPRSYSQESNPSSTPSRTAVTTYVALYLMMDDEPLPTQAVPQGQQQLASSPRIYSPISSLVQQSSSTRDSSSLRNYSSSSQDPFRSMNVSLTRQAPGASQSNAASQLSTSPLSVGMGATYLQQQQQQQLQMQQLQQMQMAQPMRPPESMIMEYTLRLVNSSPLLTKSSYFETTFPLADGNGWGEEFFIETTRISQGSGFLDRNNVLHVQCDIQVRQCTFDV